MYTFPDFSKLNANNFFSFCKDYIDYKGDAEGNYTVVALQKVINVHDETVSRRMTAVGYFSYKSQLSVIPVC